MGAPIFEFHCDSFCHCVRDIIVHQGKSRFISDFSTSLHTFTDTWHASDHGAAYHLHACILHPDTDSVAEEGFRAPPICADTGFIPVRVLYRCDHVADRLPADTFRYESHGRISASLCRAAHRRGYPGFRYSMRGALRLPDACRRRSSSCHIQIPEKGFRQGQDMFRYCSRVHRYRFHVHLFWRMELEDGGSGYPGIHGVCGFHGTGVFPAHPVAGQDIHSAVIENA